MPTVLTIDLAELYSAAVLASTTDILNGKISQGFTLSIPATETPGERAATVSNWLKYLPIGDSDIVLIEDVYPFAVNPRPALRLQGAILLHLKKELGIEPEFVMASTWQKELGYKKKRGQTSKGWAKEKCATLGLDLTPWRGKQAVDIRDAALMAYWYLGR